VTTTTHSRFHRLSTSGRPCSAGASITSGSARPRVRDDRRREVNDLTKFFTALRREEGQTMAEYGVVLAVIAVGVVLALTALSGAIQGAINEVIGWL
jgi:Flp pilus assembly pilin Flp